MNYSIVSYGSLHIHAFRSYVAFVHATFYGTLTRSHEDIHWALTLQILAFRMSKIAKGMLGNVGIVYRNDSHFVREDYQLEPFCKFLQVDTLK